VQLACRLSKVEICAARAVTASLARASSERPFPRASRLSFSSSRSRSVEQHEPRQNVGTRQRHESGHGVAESSKVVVLILALSSSSSHSDVIVLQDCLLQKRRTVSVVL